MAITTGVPRAVVRSAVNGEVLPVVVKRRRLPCYIGMTVVAGSREICREVVRVSGVIVIRFVTAVAIRRRVTVSVGMAFQTIVGDVGMRTGQRIKIVVIKCCRTPARMRRVAVLTLLRETGGYVVRVCGVIVILRVTGIAFS